MEYEHCKGRKVSVLEGEELFFNKLLSRNSSVGCSSRILYYRTAEGVPFKWEMQPGTPKEPPQEDILPPLSPPPAVLSLGLPKPCINVEEPKASMRSKLMFWKHNKKHGSDINKKVQKGSKRIDHHVVAFGSREDKFVNFGFYSSAGEEHFMGSPSNSSSSSSSSFSFSNVNSSQSSRLQSPARDSMVHGDFHGCGPWNFTSVLVQVGRKI